jgi:hypothetical protein
LKTGLFGIAHEYWLVYCKIRIIMRSIQKGHVYLLCHCRQPVEGSSAFLTVINGCTFCTLWAN